MAKDHKPERKITCNITAIHGYLNGDRTKIAATLAWNSGTPKFNIRDCFFDDKDELQIRKGIALDQSEVEKLTDILMEQQRAGKLPKVAISGAAVVDFNKIFSEAEGIVEAREEGHTTKDGFIVLRRRPGVKLWPDKK